MRILIGVNGSEESLHAVELAGCVIPPESEVGLYYSPPPIGAYDSEPEHLKLSERAAEVLAAAVFDEARGHVPEALQSTLHTVTGSGRPQEGLLAAADEWGADLIVIGARGGGPLEHPRIGSVTEGIVHGAHVPVLVVRRGAAETGGLRLLLACDQSPAAERAAEFLGQLALPEGSTGQVMTVLETPGLDLAEWSQRHPRSDEVREIAEAFLAQHQTDKEKRGEKLGQLCRDRLPAAFQESEPLVVDGHAAEEIVKAATGQQADLVVVGARGLGAFSRWLLGSTSSMVLQSVACSVLIVPVRNQP